MRKAILLCSAAIGFSISQSAVAQTDDQTSVDDGNAASGEIVVTAQRREQSLLDVPIAITAVGGGNLERAGIANATELAVVVPNLTMTGGYGKAQPNFIIRGIGSDQNLTSLVSPVGVYVDDAYMVNRTSNGVQLYDVERVEVLRGPQGTLFGRNTTGGAVNIITKRPSLAGLGGYAEFGYGNYDTKQAQGALDLTFVPDVLGIRVSGNYEETDSGFKNFGPATTDPLSGENYAGRISLLFSPNDQLEVFLKAYAGSDKHAPVPYIMKGTGPNEESPVTGYFRPDNFSIYDVESDVQDAYNNTEAWGSLATISYALNDALTLSSLTSYDGTSWKLYTDIDGGPINQLNQFQDDKGRQFNQELKLSVTADNYDVIVGGYYGSDKADVYRGLDLFFFLGEPPLNLPADPTFAAGGAALRESFIQKRKSKALFAQGDVRFGSNWTLTTGLRYTWDSIRVTNALARITDYDINPLVYTVAKEGAPEGTPLDPLSKKDSAATWRLALTHEFDGGQILYGSYSRGYRAGAFSGSFFLSAAQASFVDPEKVDTFEIGSKGKLAGNLLIYSAAVFYNKYKDQQIAQINSAGVLELGNVGSSTTYGSELEFTSYVSDALTLRSSVGLLHTNYDELTLSGVVLDGNDMPFAPKLTAQASVDWSVAQLAGGDLSLFTNVSYRSSAWFSANNDDPSSPSDTFGNGRLRQDGYALVDGSIAWEKGPVTLKVWAKNLFEKKYAYAGYDLRAYGMDMLIPGDPRTFGASVRLAFD